MTTILLHDREVATYFDLVGHDENDMTGALGWSLSQSPRLLKLVVGAVSDRNFDPDEAVIRLQEYHAEGGFSDVEVQVPGRLHVIFEAKRGWNLPSHEQLALYSRRFAPDDPDVVQAIVILTQWGAESMVEGQLGDWPLPYPRSVLGWSDVVRLTEKASAGGPLAERRLLHELAMYLRGVADMRDIDSNRVFVVSLSHRRIEGWPMDFISVVNDHGKYFFPATGKRWPKVPPNYMGFRYYGQLQSIRHVDGYTIDTDIGRHFPGAPSQEGVPHYVLTLGPPIHSDHRVANGPAVVQAGWAWADIDLLLTAQSITEARELSQRRRQG
jgi:hypothetical protein